MVKQNNKSPFKGRQFTAEIVLWPLLIPLLVYSARLPNLSFLRGLRLSDIRLRNRTHLAASYPWQIQDWNIPADGTHVSEQHASDSAPRV